MMLMMKVRFQFLSESIQSVTVAARLVALSRNGDGVRRMNQVTLRRARLVPGWVTVFGWANHIGRPT